MSFWLFQSCMLSAIGLHTGIVGALAVLNGTDHIDPGIWPRPVHGSAASRPLLAVLRARQTSEVQAHALADARDALEDLARVAREQAQLVETATAGFAQYCEERILSPAQVAGRRSVYNDASDQSTVAAGEIAKLAAQADGLSKETEDAWSSWSDAVAARANTHLAYIEEARKANMTLGIYDSVMSRLAQSDTQQAEADAAPPRNLDNLNIEPVLLQSGMDVHGTGSGFKVVIGGLKSMAETERKDQAKRENTERTQIADFQRIMSTLQKEIDELAGETEVRHARRREMLIVRKAQTATRNTGLQLLRQAMKASDQLQDVCLAAAGAGHARAADLQRLQESAKKAAKFATECIDGLGQGTAPSFLSLSKVTHLKPVPLPRAHRRPPWETGPEKPASVDPVTARMLRMFDGADQIAEEPRESQRQPAKLEDDSTKSGEVRAAQWMLLVAAEHTGKSALREEADALQKHTEAEDEQSLLSLKADLVTELRDDAADTAESEAVGDVTKCGEAQVKASSTFRETAARIIALRDALAFANASALASSIQVSLMDQDLEDFKAALSENQAELLALENNYTASAKFASDVTDRTKSKFRDAVQLVRDLNDTNARFLVKTDDPSKQTSTRAGDDWVDARNLETYIKAVSQRLGALSAKTPQEETVVGLSQNVVLGGTGATTVKMDALSSVKDARRKFEGWRDANATQLKEVETFIVDEHSLWVSEMSRCQKLMQQTLEPASGNGATAATATAESAIDGAINLLRHGSPVD